MNTLLAVGGIILVFGVLLDCYEAVILPRRVMHRYRFARLYYLKGWSAWRMASRVFPAGKNRESFLSAFGPLSLLGLFAMWMIGLVLGFALITWGWQMEIAGTGVTTATFGTYVYLSGTTIFTLGLGDVMPLSPMGRFLTVCEAGLGFGFLACVISYLPVLYQSFSRREVTISLLDARAGSPPSASQLLLRLAQARHPTALPAFLAEWERWSAEVLESQVSYPVLSFYRSQHDNQSWLAALTTVLDTCAVVIAGVKDIDPYQAQLTFAMSRHAVVDLALVFKLPPRAPVEPRLSSAQLEEFRAMLAREGLPLREGPGLEAKLAQLREMYEPFVTTLADFLSLRLPPFVAEHTVVDNWQKAAWTKRAPGFDQLTSIADDHWAG
jgi:Ion channel